MKLEIYQYSADSGWDANPDTSMDSSQTLLLFFGSPDSKLVEPRLDELYRSFPLSVLAGCSSAGEIFGDDVYDNSISLAVIQFEHTHIQLATGRISENNDSHSVGKKIAHMLNNDNLRSVFVLSDGLVTNGSKLIEGLSSELPPQIVITGGLAGDGDRFEKTWIWADGSLHAGGVCAVGFYGKHIGVGHGSRGGWDLLGPEREVTRSTDNVLYELDGQPALQLYKKYLGDRADGLPATGLLFPLAITNEEEEDGNTVRTILSVDEENNSITFAGDIPEGSYVRLMRANFDRLIDGAGDASGAIKIDDYHDGPLLNISISCVGRRLVLGPRTEEEIDAALSGLPQSTEQIGFYSYGEISPLASGKCDLHNQTMTLTLIWENTQEYYDASPTGKTA